MKVKNKIITGMVSLYSVFLNKSFVLASEIFDLGDPLAGKNDWNVGDTPTQLNNFYQFAMVSVNGLAAIGVLTSIIAFVVTAFKYSKAGSPQIRAEAINNMMTIAFTTAGLGSVPMIVWVISLIAGIA